MTPEQHDVQIDQLFKRINLKGEAIGGWSADESMEPERVRRGRKTVDHADPFNVVVPPSTRSPGTAVKSIDNV
ncbi:MAG: hypothetical protein HQL94_06830 [Magnetococcales bacterium]|nr:hypothetical protein [Magnetococcales bacterium]MBF0438226.1 hypothetical protein [Magnetococcales bacterium]